MESSAVVAVDQPPTSLTQSGLADVLGIKRQAVFDLVDRGLMVLDAEGRINLAAACAAIEGLHPSSKAVAGLPRLRATMRGEPLPPVQAQAEPESDFHAARTRREEIEAERAEIKLREERGQYVRVDAIRAVLATSVSTLRDSLLQLPPRLAPVVVTLDAPGAQELLERELQQCLTQIAGVAQSIGAAS